MKSSSIKKEAKLLLRDNWTSAMAMTSIKLVIMLSTVVLSEALWSFTFSSDLPDYGYGQILIFIILLLIYFPFRVCKCRWYSSIANGERIPANKTFEFLGTRSIVSGLRYGVSFFLRISLVFVLVEFPVSAFTMAAEVDKTLARYVTQLSLIADIVIIILTIYLSAKYFLVPYIISDNKDISVTKAFEMSSRYMKNNKMAVIELYSSFVLWFILCLAVIPYIYVKPYFDASKAVLAKKIIETSPKIVSESTDEYKGGIPEEIA